MRGIKDKLTAGIVVVVGMALIRTNADPQLWQIAFLSIGLYEAILLFIRTGRRASRKRVYNENLTVGQADMARVEEQVFNPLRRMKEVC